MNNEECRIEIDETGDNGRPTVILMFRAAKGKLMSFTVALAPESAIKVGESLAQAGRLAEERPLFGEPS